MREMVGDLDELGVLRERITRSVQRPARRRRDRSPREPTRHFRRSIQSPRLLVWPTVEVEQLVQWPEVPIGGNCHRVDVFHLKTGDLESAVDGVHREAGVVLDPAEALLRDIRGDAAVDDDRRAGIVPDMDDENTYAP